MPDAVLFAISLALIVAVVDSFVTKRLPAMIRPMLAVLLAAALMVRALE